jgi:hypothetical protein
MGKVKVITVATKADGYFTALRESCLRLGYEFVVLGWQEKWKGFGWALRLVHDFLETLPDKREVVIVVDAYDVVAVRPARDALRRFRALHTDILVSIENTEHNIFGVVVHDVKFGRCFGSSMNTGLWMGYAGALTHMLASLPIEDSSDDQKLITQFCKRRASRHAIDVDFHSLVFLTVPHDKHPQKFPDTCFVHCPGDQDMTDLLTMLHLTPVPRKKAERGMTYLSHICKSYLFDKDAGPLLVCALLAVCFSTWLTCRAGKRVYLYLFSTCHALNEGCYGR